MAWSTPRTWSPGETVTAALLNAHLRDNLNTLKVSVDDNGFPLDLLKGFAFSSGQSNGAGGSDTQLTSYDVTIPANYLAQPGDALVVEGTLVLAADANSKVAKIGIGSATAVTIASTSANVANHRVPFRVVLRRRSSTVVSITGLSFSGVAAGGAPTSYLVNSTFTGLDLTASQTLKFFAASTSAGAVQLTDYTVTRACGASGTTV